LMPCRLPKCYLLMVLVDHLCDWEAFVLKTDTLQMIPIMDRIAWSDALGRCS